MTESDNYYASASSTSCDAADRRRRRSDSLYQLAAWVVIITGTAITTSILSVAIFVIHLGGPERLIPPWSIGSSSPGAPPTPPATGFPFGPDGPFGPNGPFRPGGPLGPGGPFAPKVPS